MCVHMDELRISRSKREDLSVSPSPQGREKSPLPWGERVRVRGMRMHSYEYSCWQRTPRPFFPQRRDRDESVTNCRDKSLKHIREFWGHLWVQPFSRNLSFDTESSLDPEVSGPKGRTKCRTSPCPNM